MFMNCEDENYQEEEELQPIKEKDKTMQEVEEDEEEDPIWD